MHTGRILYMNHDNPYPSGGVRVIYSHVRHLVRNGFNAFVVHQKQDFRPPWFQDDVPTLYFDQQFALFPDDLVIIPEDHRGFLELFRSVAVRKIVFCQNHFFVFDGLGAHDSWQSLGISGVMACSEVVADFARSVLGWPSVPVVHCAVPEFFTQQPKKLQVAYMPRKRPMEAEFIRQTCTRLIGSEFVLGWVPLDNLPEGRVAEVLAESAFFLSLSRLEGLGLPPLEAMASGCVVVGFSGYGGREYASQDNGYWCEEDDLVGCAHSLARAARLLRDDGEETRRVVESAVATAGRYTPARQELELILAIGSFTG